MIIAVNSQAGESPLLPAITELGRRLARFDGYQPHANDVSALSNPSYYFGSRCIDFYLSASMSFIRWERCRIVQVPESRDLCAAHPVAARAAVDSDAMVLASIVRPSLEMYVELLVLEQSHEDSVLLDQLCQFLIWHHFAGDVEQKLTSCQEIYGCRPSYFETAAAGWRRALEQARKDLGMERVQVLGKMSKKYVAAFKSANPLERLGFGPDSFLAHAGLAYKLHFLPQKNIVYSQHDLEFLRAWCSGLLVLAGQKLCAFLRVDAAWLDAATAGFLEGFAGTADASPQPGSVVFFDWGVGVVEAVEHQPLGNEVLTIRYEVRFVPGLKSPDRIPRRFVKCELNRDRYRRICDTHEPYITENAYQSNALSEIYTALFQCRLSADAAQQGA